MKSLPPFRRLMLITTVFCGLGSGTYAQSPAPTPDDSSAILDQITSIQEDITHLKDLQSDTNLKYRRYLFNIETEALEDRLTEAQKSGDSKRADHLKGELDDMTALQEATWDQNLPILEANHKLELLRVDITLRQVQKKLDNSGELNQKTFDILQKTKETIEKYKPLLEQRFQLQKDLIPARKSLDFKTADEIYKKLGDIRKQMRDIADQSRDQLLQKLDSTNPDISQNL
ncbi:MAG TPA: hypothetical protein VK859_03805 [bacterium]|jgi:hypothetical protein|nr:hypothetical protein [bacterium]